jgi:hypothetical protein
VLTTVVAVVAVVVEVASGAVLRGILYITYEDDLKLFSYNYEFVLYVHQKI